MRVFNKDKTIELVKENCDLKKGHLEFDKLIIGKRDSLEEINTNEKGEKYNIKYTNLNIEEDILVYIPFTQKELYEQEITEIENWFLLEYREVYEKCNRKIALGLFMRDGSDPKAKLSQLYAQAETKAKRINELKSLINQIN